MLLSNYTQKRANALARLRIAALVFYPHAELLYVSGGTGSAPRKISRGRHRHSFFEAHYVLSGRIVYETEEGTRHELSEGDFLLLSPGSEHTVCDFSSDMVRLSLAFRAPVCATFPYKTARMSGTLISDLDALLSEADRKDGYAQTMIGFRAAAIASHALRTLGIHSAAKSTARAESEDHTLYHRIECYVADNPHLLLSCEAVANYCHYNVRYLNRIFKAKTGVTLLSYIHARKAESAKALLAESDTPLSEIAALLGFASPQYFHIFFKRICGTTPAEYRRRVRAQQAP